MVTILLAKYIFKLAPADNLIHEQTLFDILVLSLSFKESQQSHPPGEPQQSSSLGKPQQSPLVGEQQPRSSHEEPEH